MRWVLFGQFLAALSMAVPGFCDESQKSGEPAGEVAPARKNAEGLLIHSVMSEFQAGTTEIKVLLPDKRESGATYPVLYVLPVEAKDEKRYGDGLLEVQRHDLHNKHRLICVQPTFSHLPWYADHPTDREIRQETYFLKVVLPFVEKTYPARAERNSHLLLGFSKSGWGAWSLLLRHPETFGRAAAWDAPLAMTRPEKYGMGPIFGTQENFEKYQITPLLNRRAEDLQKEKRLILLGYDAFREHHQAVHELLDREKILHDYADGPHRKHVWESGWVSEAVELLCKKSTNEE